MKTKRSGNSSNLALTENASTVAVEVRMSYRILALLLVLSCTFLISRSAQAAGAGIPTTMAPPSANVAEQYLLNAANRDRIARGLPALRYDATLAQAARFHALQMADHRDISHQFSGEPDLMQRGSQAGVHFSLITENVAESPDSSIVHDLWMRSAGHRQNLLDPSVDSIGIAVVARGNRFYAVEDFASTVASLSFDEQEQAVSTVLAEAGLTVGSSTHTSTIENARQTCGMESGYAGNQNKPWYIVRYTADHLNELPSILSKRISTGKFSKAVVGACADTGAGAFTDYNIAVLLYP